MEELVIVSEPHGSFGALLRARRHRASLSQEQLAARAEVSERTVRNLEAGRVRSPRMATVRLLADALQLSEPERGSWFEAARSVNYQRAGPAAPGAGGPVHVPDDAPAQQPLAACGFDIGNRLARRRSSTAEFEAEIVELCQRGNRSTGRVAKDIDPDQTAARAWASRAGPGAGTRNDGPLTSADRRELAQLRRENRKLREDVEILKRAAAIFAAATR
jgi:transposase